MNVTKESGPLKGVASGSNFHLLAQCRGLWRGASCKWMTDKGTGDLHLWSDLGGILSRRCSSGQVGDPGSIPICRMER
jgi:hypothetical protein